MGNISEERRQALQAAFARIDAKQGKGSVMFMGEAPKMKVEAISTGSLAVDLALGVGGIPKGRIVEIYGPESSGKTTMALTACASVQRAGGVAAIVDAEHALDPEWAAKLGVNVDELIISQPDNGENALNVVETLVQSGAVDIIVVDSVAALTPKAELEGEIGDSHMALQARMMSQALRKITGEVSRTNTTVIFINQLRHKIGVFFGSPETTTGGNALKFYASVRMDIRRIETLKEGTDPVGNRVKVKIIKNKVAAPFKQAETDLMFGTGLSREGDLIDLGIQYKFIRKAGAWFSDVETGAQLGQGKEKTRQFLKDNPEYAADLERKIRIAAGVEVEEFTPNDASSEEGVADEA